MSPAFVSHTVRIMTVLPMLASLAYADVVDAPHNRASGVHCSDCHSYFLWWRHSPLQQTPLARGALTDALCAACHYAGSPLLEGCEHSSETMEEMHNPLLGSWQTNCLACHDPQFQSQLDWLPQGANDLYLVTGTIGPRPGFSYGENGEITTFSYSVGYESPNWIDRATWSDKTGSGGVRGLILVVDTVFQQATYQVVAADDMTITVRGVLDLNNENTSFGLIYGQFINSAVVQANNSREVRFFDPKRSENGFVDSRIPPSGICQVCHVDPNMSAWTADGQNTSHYAGSRCTDCHVPAQGFKASGAFADHTVISNGICENCHGPLDTVVAIGALHGVSAHECGPCHASLRPEVIAAIASGGAGCTDCHAEQTVHQAVYFHTDQVDMPLIMTDGRGRQTWREDRLPFGGRVP